MTEHLTDVKEVPSKDWMTRWSALQVANESTQGIAASALFCEVVAEIETLRQELRAAQDYAREVEDEYRKRTGHGFGDGAAQPPGRPAHEREPPHCSTCSCGMESQQPEGVPARELCSLRQHVLLGFTTDARAEIQWAIARIEDLQRENAALRSANKMNGELLVEAIAHAAVVSTPPPSLTWETFDGMPEPSLDVLKRVAARMRETAPDTAYLAQWAVEQIEEHDQSFDLRWRADMRAIKRWQEAHPGNDLTWPDHADLCVWLLEQLDARAAKPPGDEETCTTCGATWRNDAGTAVIHCGRGDCPRRPPGDGR